jgi:UTP--glucose-1-phosphate uridylyltransferase
MATAVRKVVFPVAGLGTRFLPATKAIPKEMLPIVDKPLIQYAVEEALAAGITDIIFVTGRGKTAMVDHFDHAFELEATLKAKGREDLLRALTTDIQKPGQVMTTRQQEPLGLGHAVWCARHLVGREPFAVMLPDDLVDAKPGCMSQLVEVHNKTGGNVVAVEQVPRDQTDRYGIIDIASDDGRLVAVKGMVEKPKPKDAPSTLSIIGRYILLPEVFDHLDRHERGMGGEIQLTDAMAKMLGRTPFHGVRFSGVRYDCGNKLGFLKASFALALERADLKAELSAFLKSKLK